VPVARVAMLHGINANLLRSWIAKSDQPNPHHGLARALPGKALASPAAFMAVQVTEPAAPTTAPAALCLHVRLPNGVALDVGQAPPGGDGAHAATTGHPGVFALNATACGVPAPGRR